MVTLSRLSTEVAEHYVSCEPDEKFPPVTTLDLVHTSGSSFCVIVRKF